MNAPAPACSLLDELDARQNEVLDQLEALDARISATIKEWSVERKETPVEPMRDAA